MPARAGLDLPHDGLPIRPAQCPGGQVLSAGPRTVAGDAVVAAPVLAMEGERDAREHLPDRLLVPPVLGEPLAPGRAEPDIVQVVLVMPESEGGGTQRGQRDRVSGG